MRRREHRTNAREPRRSASLDGGGTAGKDEPRAMALDGRDDSERVAAPKPSCVIPRAAPTPPTRPSPPSPSAHLGLMSVEDYKIGTCALLSARRRLYPTKSHSSSTASSTCRCQSMGSTFRSTASASHFAAMKLTRSRGARDRSGSGESDTMRLDLRRLVELYACILPWIVGDRRGWTWIERDCRREARMDREGARTGGGSEGGRHTEDPKERRVHFQEMKRLFF